MARANLPDGALYHERQGRGEPLVLLHGIGGELCVWEPVLDQLARHCDVIAVDLPGFGNSPALASDVVPSPAALAASVAGLLAELGIERAHVAGNSLGGWVALEMARSGHARSVVGLCPAGLWGAPLQGAGAATRGRAHRIVRRLRPLLWLLLRSRRARRVALRPFVADPDKVPYHAAWRMVRSYGRAAAYDATSTAMRQSYFHDPDQINVPVLLAFGEQDRYVLCASAPLRFAPSFCRAAVISRCGMTPPW